jgi:hypothetical protein
MVTLTVTDKDGATGSRSLNRLVTVITPAQGLRQAAQMVNDLASAAGLNSGNTNSLLTKIDAAQKQLGMGNAGPAANQLQSALNELDAMIRSGRMTAADAAPLQALVNRLISSISL